MDHLFLILVPSFLSFPLFTCLDPLRRLKRAHGEHDHAHGSRFFFFTYLLTSSSACLVALSHARIRFLGIRAPVQNDAWPLPDFQNQKQKQKQKDRKKKKKTKHYPSICCCCCCFCCLFCYRPCSGLISSPAPPHPPTSPTGQILALGQIRSHKEPTRRRHLFSYSENALQTLLTDHSFIQIQIQIHTHYCCTIALWFCFPVGVVLFYFALFLALEYTVHT